MTRKVIQVDADTSIWHGAAVVDGANQLVIGAGSGIPRLFAKGRRPVLPLAQDEHLAPVILLRLRSCMHCEAHLGTKARLCDSCLSPEELKNRLAQRERGTRYRRKRREDRNFFRQLGEELRRDNES